MPNSVTASSLLKCVSSEGLSDRTNFEGGKVPQKKNLTESGKTLSLAWESPVSLGGGGKFSTAGGFATKEPRKPPLRRNAH